MDQCRRVARPFAGDRKSFALPAADGDNHDSSQRSSGHAISHLSGIGLAQHISIRASAGTNNSTTSYRSTQATPAGFRTGLCRIRGQHLTCQIRLLTVQSGLSQIHLPSPPSLDTPNERASARHLKISRQSSAPGSPAHKLPYFGAIQNRKASEISATVPTPPSQSAANHNRRCASGRGFRSGGINDTRFQAVPCHETPNRPTQYNRGSAGSARRRQTARRSGCSPARPPARS